jgi:ADP-ribose pyrophosphatase YjhB (NUDIX family)
MIRWRPNVTVAAVIQQSDNFLLVEERIDGLLVFNQPAGHLEENESLLQAVTREVREETCRLFTPTSLVGLYKMDMPEDGLAYLRFCFSGDVSEPDKALQADECILRSIWMSHEEIIQNKSRLRSPMVLQCINDYLEQKRYPLDIIKDVEFKD